MFIVDLIFASIVGLLLAVLFSALFDTRGPWDVFWAFLLIVILGSWVGGLWLVPFGPVLFDVAWIPFLLAGVFFALLLAAATPPRRTVVRGGTAAPGSEAALAFSIFFWILLSGFIAVIILAYV